MTNGDLMKILQRFPPEGTLKLRRHDARAGELLDVDHAEMAIDPAPYVLGDQNVAWADLAKERIQVVLVFGTPTPKVAVAAAPDTRA